MTSFLLYIARAGLYLGLFYAFYLLVMRRTTFFRLNRVLLLCGSFLCLALPFFRLRTVATATAGIASELSMVAGAETVQEAVRTAFPWKEVLLAVYAAGALATLTLYALSARKIMRMMHRGESTSMDGCRLILMDEDVPSFSWGRRIVMSRKDLAENPAILTHEMMHVHCRHFVDLLLFFPLQLLFWWNPLVWITREELRLLHEYEADEGVIRKGIDATGYQLLLVRKAVGEHRFTLASGFQHAKLKSRIEMMLKPGSSGWMRWSYAVLVPVLGCFMFICNPVKAVNLKDVTETITEESAPRQRAEMMLFEQMPRFNGGGSREFSQWVNSHSQLQGRIDVDGRMIVQFTVGADGEVRDVKVLESLREDIDREMVQLISSSPRWEPGLDPAGQPVPVTFSFPILFVQK
ncbi:MAG: energy transducer TonB [Bacteroidales bacterium]|nr:energy transducer TonB [Bacteroidales bacterium]MBR4686984.1 energy transducer TonB [Bacteroidales bacterium]